VIQGSQEPGVQEDLAILEAEALKYLVLGQKLQSENLLRQAEECYRQAIASNHQLWEAYQYLADLLIAANQSDAALAVYRQGIQHNPKNARYFFALAQVLTDFKKWHNASLRYQQALKLNPHVSWGYLNWAKVLVELQQWEEAREATNQAIQLKPDLWEAYHHLGKILQHQHQWQGAVSAYQKAIELNSQFLHAYLRLAEVYRHLQQHKSAIDCYNFVVDRAEAKSPLLEQAIASYTTTLENYPQPTAQQYYELGKICRAKSLFPQAISAYQQAIKIEPQFSLPYISIQYTPIKEKQLAELINFYQQLVTENQNIPLAWGNLGDAFSQQNKIAEAITCYQTSCYQRVIKRYPQLANLDWQKPKQNPPNFIIAGASKGGTSSLYNYLSYHPQLLLSHKKELDFFWQNFDYGINWYLAHFPTITDNDNWLTGEATPNYLRFPGVAQRIKAYCPQTKIIILLRNPVDRTISWHYHKINTGLTKGDLENAIAQEIQQLETLSETELMAGGYRPIDNIFSSLYYYQLKAWMEYLPRKQFLILKSEDFYENTAAIMKQVFDFLGIPTQQLKEYSKVNVGSYKNADPAIRRKLSEYFKSYNQQLEELLNLEFNWE
jgi:tetratricopeptide (TPR) repeat protein